MMSENYNNQGTPMNVAPNGGGGNEMTLKDWIITVLLTAIPCVNIVALLVWAFSSSGNINRQNYAKATLIVMLVLFVLGIVLNILFAGMFAAIFSSVSRGYY